MNDRLVAAALFAASLAVFLPSRQHALTDSRHAMLVSEHVLAKRDWTFDAYFTLPLQERQWQIVRHDGRLRYWYPAGGPILSIPFAGAMRIFGLSCITREGRVDEERERTQQRILAAVLMAALVALTFATARLLLPPGWSAGIALAVAFSTQVWTTASRCMWSDTWGLLLLAGALHLVLAHAAGKAPLRPIVLATLLSWAYFVRPTYCTAAAAVAAYVFVSHRAQFFRLAVAGAAWFVAFSGFYLSIFGSLLPDYHRYGFTLAAVPHGVAALLVSPSRGLLFTIPVLPAVAWALVRFRGELRHAALVRMALAGVALHVAMMSAWECWWGGPSMLSRLTTGVVPFLALLAMIAADAWRAHATALRVPAVATALLLAAGVFVHGSAAFSPQPWAWNAHPQDIDEDPRRAWDLREPQFLAAAFPHRGPGVARLRREAEALIEAGRPRDAILRLDRGLELYPNALNLYMTRGVALHTIGDHDGEMRDFEKAIALNPLIPEAHYNRAIAREERGDAAGALADYAVCIYRDRTFVPAYIRRASLRLASADMRGALADFESVIATDPTVAGAYAGRGSIRESQGDLRGARADYEEYLRRVPESAPGRSAVAERLARLGQ